jgi:hypothetical protein
MSKLEPSATSSVDNRKYNDELALIESVYEFHPDAFDTLSIDEVVALQEYYLIGREVPNNIFAYRERLVERDRTIAASARLAFRRVCENLGIEI